MSVMGGRHMRSGQEGMGVYSGRAAMGGLSHGMHHNGNAHGGANLWIDPTVYVPTHNIPRVAYTMSDNCGACRGYGGMHNHNHGHDNKDKDVIILNTSWKDNKNMGPGLRTAAAAPDSNSLTSNLTKVAVSIGFVLLGTAVVIAIIKAPKSTWSSNNNNNSNSRYNNNNGYNNNGYNNNTRPGFNISLSD